MFVVKTVKLGRVLMNRFSNLKARLKLIIPPLLLGFLNWHLGLSTVQAHDISPTHAYFLLNVVSIPIFSNQQCRHNCYVCEIWLLRLTCDIPIVICGIYYVNAWHKHLSHVSICNFLCKDCSYSPNTTASWFHNTYRFFETFFEKN